MLHDLVEREDPPPGLLALDDDTPVGWCAVGPRQRYLRMMSDRARTFRRIDDRRSWVVNCFYIDPQARGHGVGTVLLDAAIEFAGDNGATILEGYPIDLAVTDPGAAGLYVGTLHMFEAAGFVEVARFGNRPFVRLELPSTGRGVTPASRGRQDPP
jgi:GNAT superfamily N-acetyltransferase